MSPSYDITTNAIEQIHQNHTNFFPTVQVLDIKKIQNSSSSDRYRLVISDGKHYQQSMLATQLNELVTSNQVQENSLVRLKEFICNEVQTKKVVIILKMEVVVSAVAERIGHPVEYGKSSSSGNQQSSSYQSGGHLNTMQSAPVTQAPPQYQSHGSSSSAYGGGGGYGGSSAATPPKAPMYNPGGGSSSYSGGRQQGAVVRQEPGAMITPIDQLNPYVNRWTIKARVTAKSDIRRWSNPKGEGTLFSVDLLDEQGGEIRGTFFKEACEKFYPILEPGSVYTFSGGRLKVAQKQYTSLKSNYEITFDMSTSIQPVDDDHRISAAHYNFRNIAELESVEPGAVVDIIGVVKSFSPDTTINTKTGRETQKRDIVVADASGVEVRLTVWGEKATQQPDRWENYPVIAIKGVKVSDYNGRSLSTLPGSQLSFQPDLPEARTVFDWWHSGGSSGTTSISTGGSGGMTSGSIDTRGYMADIKDNSLGHAEKPDYLEVKATVTFFRREPDPWYRSCTLGDCKRKVVEELEGYRCEKCQRSMPNCNYRYVLSLNAGDISGSQYLSCFDEHAQILLKKTAEELYQLKSSGMESEADAVFTEPLFSQWIVRLRVKAEMVSDEQRIKCTIASLKPIDFVRESREMIKAIGEYN